ncbi:MAG: pyridoxamine 5'-phosphate oxidase family protein [Pseudomonadota bacterium]|nr:pyridoxamine 5'-phosphate oxidase family protein [Pseudomonadota bacterium]
MDRAAGSFHAGERALQVLAGSAPRLAELGPQLIRDHLPEQHRDFFRQLPCVVVGGLDADGQPRASLWAGPPGFAHSPEPALLQLAPASVAPADPLWGRLAAGAPLAVLGIEPHTRRRNRANGRLRCVDDRSVLIDVQQSFGNCPKYIVPRRAEWCAPAAHTLAAPASAPASPDAPGPRVAPGDLARPGLGPHLDASARRLIAQSDTFFIASAAAGAGALDAPAAAGVDVSHRAGPPGFVAVTADADGIELCVPDYPGNRFFNTLGNLLQEPRAGLLFADFADGTLLWLSATARIDSDPAAVAAATTDLVPVAAVGPFAAVAPVAAAATGAAIPGAQRLLRLRIRDGVRGPAPAGLAWHCAAEARS